jgi:hypothetical protein
MTSDRLTQIAALAVAAVSLAGSAIVGPMVSRQRADLQLSWESMGGNPSQYAVLTAGLGSFRGVAINALWYRAEMEKREGRYAEANNLASWITNLQPRIPGVWSFQAWNLSYNISVGTFTPQERWDWVNKGIHLLREQGIKYNPGSLTLYRELAWLFFHKVGQYADDMNWYYKAEIAREFQELLGGPNDRFNAQGVLAYMQEIADDADRYLLFSRPPVQVREQLRALTNSGDLPEIADDLDELLDMGVLRLQERLDRLHNTLMREKRPKAAERLRGTQELLREQVRRAERDPVAVFQEENPQATLAIRTLRDGGFPLNASTLRAIGRVQLYARFGPPEWMLSLPDSHIGEDGRRMIRLLANTSPELSDSLARLLPFLRAKVLLEDYNMDPMFMVEVMQRYGPADWRDANSHALYWSALGIEKAPHIRGTKNLDYINTKRGVLHALQSMVDTGNLSYNPLNPVGMQVDLMPNPEFLDAYGKALDEAIAEGKSGEFGENIDTSLYESGHENYLQKAVMLAYLYGDEQDARRYYQQLRERYGDRPQNRLADGRLRYSQPLADIVYQFMVEDSDGMTTQTSIRFALESIFLQTFEKGLAADRPQVFAQLLTRGQQFYDRYQQERDYTGANEARGRLTLPPYIEMVTDAFVRFMQEPRYSVFSRRNAYVNAPDPLVVAAYPRFISIFKEQAQQQGIPADQLDTFLPPPPDAQATVQDAPLNSGTLERK